MLNKLFQKKKPSLRKPDGQFKTSGELITEVTDGANLVNDKETWEHAEDKKHDLDTMKKCCDAELKTMEKAGIVPAPYYFERVAILSRKEQNYEQEINYCSLYIDVVDEFYKNNSAQHMADVRKGPRYKSIVRRLEKAKELQKI